MWERLEPSGCVWERLETLGNVWDRLGASGWIRSKCTKHVKTHFGERLLAFGSVWYTFGTVWERVEASGSVWERLGTSEESGTIKEHLLATGSA